MDEYPPYSSEVVGADTRATDCVHGFFCELVG